MKAIYVYMTMIILTMGACTKGFNDIENPNSSTVVPPAVLFTGVSRAALGGLAEAGQQAAQFYVSYNGGALDEITYFFQRNSFAEYDILRNVEQLRIETEQQKAPEYYLGLAKFFRAYLLVQLTQKVGDIPYSEALMAKDGVTSPKYDTQKAVYVGVLKELEEANNLIPATGTLTGDIIFDGTLLKWKKLVNTFRLRVLMSLSLKTGDADIDVMNQFKMIYENPAKYPVMQSNADNAAFKYYDVTGARHFWSAITAATPYRLCTTLGNVLRSTADPRLPKFFEIPAATPTADPNLPASYKSIDHGVTTATSAALIGTTSALHNRYIGKPVGEPYLQVAYHELQFILAEASFRGWISGDPELFYNEGIKNSCRFYGIAEPDITTFLAGNVKYVPNDGLKMICTQRWVGYFMNSGYEAYWNHRRTRVKRFDETNTNTDRGYPEFTIGVVNRNDGKLANRFLYPLNEVYYNERNLTDAVVRQYGTDHINGLMWSLIKQ